MFLFVDDKVLLLVDGDYTFIGDSLVSTDILTGAPVIGSPTLTSESSGVDLDAADVLSGAPIVSDATLRTIHALTADEILSGTPILGTPSLEKILNLIAESIESGTPVIDFPAIGEENVLAALDVLPGIPVVDPTQISQAHGLSAVDISVIPIVGTAYLLNGTPPSEIIGLSVNVYTGVSAFAAVSPTVYTNVRTSPVIVKGGALCQNSDSRVKMQRTVSKEVQVIK